MGEEPNINKVFSSKEISQLENALIDHRLRALFLLALGTGLRQGELLGLKWSDINFDKKEIHVKRTIRQINFINENGTMELKTVEQPFRFQNNIRDVAIPSKLIPILKAYKLQQQKEKSEVSNYANNDFVFTTANGKVIYAKNLLEIYKNLLKKSNIPYRQFHCLRRTYMLKKS